MENQFFQQGSLMPVSPIVPGTAVPMPRAPLPHFTNANEDEELSTFERISLEFDSANEHMVLRTFVETETLSSSDSTDPGYIARYGTKHKRRKAFHDREISNGCVKLLQVYCLIDENGTESLPQCEVELIYREPKATLALSVEAIYRKDKAVQDTLGRNGVTFIKDGFKVWCEKFADQINQFQVQRRYMDFYKDVSGNWCHSQAEKIALKAADSYGVLDRLGIDFSEKLDNTFLRTTLLLYGICGRLFTVIRGMLSVSMAKLAIVYPERGAALEDLKALYCSGDNPPLYPGKLFEKQIFAQRNEVVLISFSTSGYMNEKCLETLSQHESEMTALPLLLAKNEGDLSCRNDVIRINYSITDMGGINDVLCWAVRTLLNDTLISNRLEENFDRYRIMVKDDTETVAAQNLLAMLMALAEVYLPLLGVSKEQLIPVLQGYSEYLISMTGSSSQIVIDQLKKFLTSYRDIPLRCYCNRESPDKNSILLKDSNMLLLSKPLFEHIAEKCGTTRISMAGMLTENHVLKSNNGSHMLNIRFDGCTERMYAIECLSLFTIGELRPMCDDEDELKPLYKIPIGMADNYNIFFDIYPLDSKLSNSFALITGATGVGKSTLCKTLAVNAARLGLSVVSLGMEYPLGSLECNLYEPAENTDVSANKFFESLYDELTEEETALADTARELVLEQSFESYSDVLDTLTGLIGDEEGSGSLLVKAREICDQLSDFTWDKAVVDGDISWVMAQTSEQADRLLSDFFDYKSKQAEIRHTLLLLDETQIFSWDGKSPMVSKILRQGRKYGIIGVFSTQFLNADNGKNISAALKQITTQFVFRPSDEIAAAKLLGYSSKDIDVRSVLELLDTGEAMAKGNISSDKCALDYPVKFSVNPIY